MPDDRTTAPTLADRLASHDRVVEVGIGDRPDLARALAARGVAVVATDRRPVAVPSGVRFVRDDVVARARRVRTDPGPYRGADAVYARRLPPELHRPARVVAGAVGATLAFTTLGGDPPTVPTRPVTLGRTTLHVAAEGPRG